VITKDYFTKTSEELFQEKFRGVQYKKAQNGVYLVCHLDIFQLEEGKDRVLSEEDICERGPIWTAYNKLLGADNRAGCYIVHEMSKQYPECGVLISFDEEHNKDIQFFTEAPKLEDPKAFIAFDRRGVCEYVDYEWGDLSIQKFLASIGIYRNKGLHQTVKSLSFKYLVPCINMCIATEYMHNNGGFEYLNVDILESLIPTYSATIDFCINNKLDTEPKWEEEREKRKKLIEIVNSGNMSKKLKRLLKKDPFLAFLLLS
jgi:hypothetical protein